MPNKPLSLLTIDELFERLTISKGSSLSITAKYLKDEDIDGEVLMALTDAEIDELDLKKGPKKALKEFIASGSNTNSITVQTKEPVATNNSQMVGGGISTTAFTIESQVSLGGGSNNTITPSISQPFNPSSYGDFVITLFDRDGNQMASNTITVSPDLGIQLPQMLQVLLSSGEPLTDCQVFLVELVGNTENIISDGKTNDNGEFQLPEDLPDGAYILRTMPNKIGLQPKEIEMVVALGLRPQSKVIPTLPQHAAYSNNANLTTNPTEQKDANGNASSIDRGLIREGGLKGSKLLLLDMYQGPEASFSKLIKSLQWTGLEVIKQFSLDKCLLEQCCQLWIISGHQSRLSSQNVKDIINFYNQGNGVYLWGDNDPCYVEANLLGKEILGITMSGNTPGMKTVKRTLVPKSPGFVWHPVFTGLSSLYEGITIATIDRRKETKTDVEELLWGSASNLVTIAHQDKDNHRRIMMDTGFTRVFDECWDTAGTSRFVTNCAGWLANLEQPRSTIPKQ
eukprot:gene12798-15019_t